MKRILSSSLANQIEYKNIRCIIHIRLFKKEKPNNQPPFRFCANIILLLFF